MSLTRAALVYVVTLVTFFAIDLLWLGIVAKNFYRQHLGHLLASQVNWPPAILFYLLYIAGIVFFVVKPALDAQSATRAALSGAALGFLAYATYDLTNHATMRDWPPIVTIVDLAWGTVLTGTVAFVSYHMSSRLPGLR